jgi:hypothetical protein
MSKPNFAKASKQTTKARQKNALAHGIYGKDILLPWKSREEFEALLTDLRNEFQPDGRMENETVFDIAHLRWQKCRLHQMHIAAAHRDPFVSDLVDSGKKSWAGMRSFLQEDARTARMFADLLPAVFLEQVKEGAQVLAKAIKEGKFTSPKDQIDRTNAFVNVTKNFTLPLIEAFEARPTPGDSLRRTYSPEYLEPIIRLEAMIDARIDKALGRLVSLKEYKRVAATYCPPISADASTPSTPCDTKGTVVQLKRSVD